MMQKRIKRNIVVYILNFLVFFSFFCVANSTLDDDSISSSASTSKQTLNTISLRASVCGNGVRETGESCDDGNTRGGDGCSSNCLVIEPGYTCTMNTTTLMDLCVGICGDGIIQYREECDDSDIEDADGCSSICTIEAGYSCISQPSICAIRCGDGVRGVGESCDDDNQIAGDGCSTTCTVEGGWSCPATTTTCSGICGDGLLENDNSEQCDDGNSRSGDGCSSACKIESGFYCTNTVGNNPVSVCVGKCGDGVTTNTTLEQCDDGNIISGDGCSSSCTVESGWQCPIASGGIAVCVGICGDGRRLDREMCDDGNTTNGDGCNSDCLIESGWRCSPSISGSLYSTSVCSALCGDGLPQLSFSTATGTASVIPNSCDDGNNQDGDGCSSTCTIESGYTCSNSTTTSSSSSSSSTASTCSPTCGDARLVGKEVCDDGNLISGDGCSSSCQVETGWSCSEMTRICSPVCGDGRIIGSEECDDGNLVNGDGCSSTCKVETGFSCSSSSSSASYCVPNCGDGMRQSYEECDDGNTLAADGCLLCHVETGWFCTESAQLKSTCAPICGDGLTFPLEACDDGNLINNDGCSSTCQVEQGWQCSKVTSMKTACTPICGDGLVKGSEECDDGNVLPLDGCSSVCKAELGYSCTDPKNCVAVCGDSKRLGSEGCDDGNVKDNDGCSSICSIERGFSCDGNLGGISTCTGICGDGKMTAAEICDDGNTDSYDGCSSTCSVESGFTCYTVDGTSVCVAVCGDGKKKGSEGCDDGNLVSGDGCSAYCRVETGFDCSAGTSCSAICGDSLRLGSEVCDDGNKFDGDGCSADCKTIETGFTCTTPSGAVSTCKSVCGDGKVTSAESCDDGNTSSGDGCSSTCTVESTWACSRPALTAASTVSVCAVGCGTLPPTSPEECDDGNSINGDGCNQSCQIEQGWSCRTSVVSGVTKSVCFSVCGDGYLAKGTGGEECDDGNIYASDGCSQTCKIEAGYSCTQPTATSTSKTTPSLCSPVCGDTIIVAGEACDDGNAANGDGCSSQCQIETGWSCTRITSTSNNNGMVSQCTPICGDGLVVGGEVCDDGNRNSQDGCSSTCQQIDLGFTCQNVSSQAASKIVCSAICGDGLRKGSETCDDGNRVNGDGCSSLCSVESGFQCSSATIGNSTHDFCSCLPGFAGPSCNCTRDSSCRGRGECLMQANGCLCDAPYFGTFCEIEYAAVDSVSTAVLLSDSTTIKLHLSPSIPSNYGADLEISGTSLNSSTTTVKSGSSSSSSSSSGVILKLSSYDVSLFKSPTDGQIMGSVKAVLPSGFNLTIPATLHLYFAPTLSDADDYWIYRYDRATEKWVSLLPSARYDILKGESIASITTFGFFAVVKKSAVSVPSSQNGTISSPSSGDSDSDAFKLSTAAIIGIVIAAVAFIGLLASFIFKVTAVFRRQKQTAVEQFVIGSFEEEPTIRPMFVIPDLNPVAGMFDFEEKRHERRAPSALSAASAAASRAEASVASKAGSQSTTGYSAVQM